MSLSVNCMTRGPAARVAAMLRVLRAAADEIVVAVDERAGHDVYSALATVADRLVRYPYADPVDRPLAWLHAQCSGRWVLTIDDDEIPSAALVEALPDLVRATDVTHYWLPRRWLYPDLEHFLAQPPWQPDYQLRLVENDPRLLFFPDETHKPIVALGPGRYVDVPLLHADCVLNPIERRREKARRYERSRPGKRMGGRPMNELYYVPEVVGEPRRRLLSREDAAAVRSIVEASQVEARDVDVASLPRARREEIDELWSGRALGDSAYHARLEVLDEWPALAAGEVRGFDVRVENLGHARWAWGEWTAPEIRVSYRWRTPAGEVVVADGLRTPLPVSLAPGDATIVPVQVAAPASLGHFRLEIDLVHEHVRWFGAGVTCDVEVTRQPRLGLVGDDDGVIRAELARLAELAPAFQPVVFSPTPERIVDALGLPSAPSLERYLLDGLPRRRAGAAVLAARTAALVRAARRLRSGREVTLPRGADAFLDEVRTLEGVVVASENPPVRAAAVLAADALGLPSVMPPGLRSGGRAINRALLAIAARRASRFPGGLEEIVASLRPSPDEPTPAAPTGRVLPEWEYVPEGWARALDREVKGWNVDAVADAYRAKWPSFVRAVESGGPLGIYHESVAGREIGTDDEAAHNMVVTFGYVLALAARGKQRLAMLDWGGGSGHYYVLAKALLPGVELDYHCKDVPKLAALGRELVPEGTFYDDDSCLNSRYDLVFVSGALQYAEDWRATLRRLASAADSYLYVTRLPIAFRAPSFVVLQRAYAYGYDTEYLGWVLNREALLESADEAGLRLVREFLLMGSFSAFGAPEDPVFHRGFLWRPRPERSRSSSELRESGDR